MKKLLCLMLFCLLLNSTIYGGNKSGFMTTDQKDALDGADTPSASNVLATIKDVEEQDSGVQTITPGVNLSNSGDADNPILDLDISEDIDMNTSYQLKHLAAPAADGEAIRQTSKLTESSLESGIDRLSELESTDTPQFASVNIAGNYQFPQAIGSSGEALKVPAAGSLLEWGSAGSSYAQVVDVAKSGGDFTTITAALNDISDADSVVRYAIKLHPGEYDETVTCKEFVDIIGVDRHTCRITKSDAHTMVAAANVTIANLSLYNTHASSASYTFYNASSTAFVMRNCYIERMASLADAQIKAIRAYGLTDMYNCEVYAYNTGNVGGAIGITTTQPITIDNCKITANGKGAISEYVQPLIVSTSAVTLRRSYLEAIKTSSNYLNAAVTVSSGTITAYDCEFISNDIYSVGLGSVGNILKSCYLNSGIRLGTTGVDVYLYNSTVKGTIVGISGQPNPVYSYCSHYDAITDATAYPQTKAHTILNVAAGNIAATDVQSAVDELDDEKADIAGDDTITGLWRFDAMILTPKALADSPTSPEEGHFWWDSTVADTGPKVYLGGKWCKLLTNEGGYTRTVKIPATAARVGATAPTETSIENTRGLGFDADGELAFIATPIPQDWDGASDLTFKTSFCGTSGDAIADTETVKFDISYNSVAEGEAVDNGTEKTATATYTQSGAGTDKEMIIVNITIDYDDGDQPITAGDALFIKFNRDVTTDTYSGAAIVQAWALQYTSDDVPK